jgi:type-F conjugative transfer system pilin assembly protein TrbC
MKNIFIFFILSFVASLSYSQTNTGGEGEQDPQIRSRQVIENAIAQARSMQANQNKAGERNGLSPQELRKTQGVDPAKLAAKYQGSFSEIQKSSPELMVFISTSMPKKALLMLGEQARAAGAVLVLRGMKGVLGTKGVMEETTKALQPIADTGAAIQIDPEAFGRYHVTAVPTFVIATKEESCGTDICDAKSYALAGDVTLEYALEQWSSRGGAIGKQADMYLRRISRSQ